MLKLIITLILCFPLIANAGIHCLQIPVNAVTPAELAKIPASYGAAITTNSGAPMILYDKQYESQPEVLNHIMAHECAHHVLGHVKMLMSMKYYANERLVENTENSADCLASKILVNQLGYNKTEFDIVTAFIIDNFPDGVERAAHILQCANLPSL